MKFLSNPLMWLLLGFSLYFLGQGAVGFVGPDEPRYADVARGMLRTGDYITPRLFGEPWFEKPPLYYWLAALFFRLSENEIGARLPSALAAVAFLVFWFRFARQRFGTRAAMLASMVLGSTLGWIGFAHAAVMDMLLAATLDSSLALLALWFWKKEEQYLWGFYVFLGLATLAKGPVAIVLAGSIALAYLVTYRDWKTLKETLYSPGLAFFILVAVPWYLICYQRNGDPFIQEFFIKHNWGRFTSTALGHPQPIWFYFPIVAAGLFPWAPLLLLPVVELFRAGLRGIFANRERTFLIYWVFIVFLFFSLSRNKLPSYILPILPPLTLWIALLVEKERPEEEPEKAADAAEKDRNAKRESQRVLDAAPAAIAKAGEDSEDSVLLPRIALWLIGASALLLLTIPFIAALLGDSISMGLRHALASVDTAHLWSAFRKGPVPPVAVISLMAPVGLSIYMLWRRDLVEAAFFVVVGVALSMMGIVGYVSPAINRVASVRTVAQRMQVFEIAGDQVAISGIRRDQSLGLGYYLDYPLPEWDALTSPPSIGYVISKDSDHVNDGRSMVLFPGQHLRLWVLPPSQFEIKIETEPKKGA